MSVGHCMHLAIAISAKPMDEWAADIKALPASCLHADCGQPRNCHDRIAGYLRVQYRAQRRRAETSPRQQGSLL